jgi:hypothetical protein
MVAVAQLIPQDPKEQASVLAVLREHPELRAFIQQASTRAEELFPGVKVQLDTVRYDDWDPPLRMVLVVPGPLEEWNDVRARFISWLRDSLAYPEDLIFVFPQWGGPTRTRDMA